MFKGDVEDFHNYSPVPTIKKFNVSFSENPATISEQQADVCSDSTAYKSSV